MIEVKNLTRYYGTRRAINNISFQIEKGEVVGFLGPNGAGKSTTMNIISCILPASSGSAKINGFDTFEQSLEIRKVIGYLPETPPLYSDMIVADYLNFAAGIRGVDAKRISSSVDRVIEKCSLKDVSRRIIGRLSKGYQQRVGLARALAADPEFLLMDEPFSALDPLIRRQLQTEFIKLSKQMKKTTVFITHDLDEAVRVGHRIAIMRDGMVVQIGTPEEIVINPADEYVADFVKGISRLKVVQAKTIMKSTKDYESKFGPLGKEFETVDENDLLSKLIETSISKDKPIIVSNKDNENIGVITQSDLLRAVVEGNEGE